MEKKYFDDCTTESQVKREYRKLSHKHHPDKPGGDKATFQEIEAQKKAALRRIAVSEGKAASYYEDLAAQVGKSSFAASVIKAAQEIDKKLEDQGVTGNSFGEIFNAVAKIFHTPKSGSAIGQEKQEPKSLPGNP